MLKHIVYKHFAKNKPKWIFSNAIALGMLLKALTFCLDVYIVSTGFYFLIKDSDMPKEVQESHTWGSAVSGVIGAFGSACYSFLLQGSVREANTRADMAGAVARHEHQGRIAAEAQVGGLQAQVAAEAQRADAAEAQVGGLQVQVAELRAQLAQQQEAQEVIQEDHPLHIEGEVLPDGE